MEVDGIDANIDTKMLKTIHYLLFHLANLDNGRNPYIGTLKKDRAEILSDCCAEILKTKFLRYVNGVLFDMVIKELKDTYLLGTTPTKLQN